MKYALFLLAGLCFSVLTRAQSDRSAIGRDKLKVTLSRDSMLVFYKNLPVSVSSIQALDSFLKKVPDPGHLSVEFESRNANPEKIRAIDAVLDQCHCPTVRSSMKFQE